MQLTRVDANSKALPTVLASVSIRLLGMRHCGNIENDMIPITLLEMTAMRASGFYPNPVAFASDDNTVIN
jgi:hypothetical protein